MDDFIYQVGQRVKLRPRGNFVHQRGEWKSEYAIIRETYISSGAIKGKWYKVTTPGGYGNSYPEKDLMPFAINTNLEAKQLLSKEW